MAIPEEEKKAERTMRDHDDGGPTDDDGTIRDRNAADLQGQRRCKQRLNSQRGPVPSTCGLTRHVD